MNKRASRETGAKEMLLSADISSGNLTLTDIGSAGALSSGREGVFFCDQIGNVRRLQNGEGEHELVLYAGPQFAFADVYCHNFCLVLHKDSLLLTLPDYKQYVDPGEGEAEGEAQGEPRRIWIDKPAAFGPDAEYELRRDAVVVRRVSDGNLLVDVADSHTLLYELLHKRVCIKALDGRTQWLQKKAKKHPFAIASSEVWPPAHNLTQLLFYSHMLLGEWHVTIHRPLLQPPQPPHASVEVYPGNTALSEALRAAFLDCVRTYQSECGIVFVRSNGSVAVLRTARGDKLDMQELQEPCEAKRDITVLGEHVLVQTTGEDGITVELWSLKNTTKSLFSYSAKDIKSTAITTQLLSKEQKVVAGGRGNGYIGSEELIDFIFLYIKF